MNRTEFMRQLERLLQSVPQQEREEALQYYNDYFDDAGAENEKEVLDALGNPAKVAENIKRDLYGEEAARWGTVKNPPANYSNGDDSNGTSDPNQTSGRYQTSGDYCSSDSGNTSDRKKDSFFSRMGARFDSLPVWGQVLIVIGCVLLTPAIFGILSAIIGALFSLVTGWFSLILSFGIAAIALITVLIILVIVGFSCVLEAPVGALALVGFGLFCGGLGILFLMLTVAMAGIATPAIFRGIAKLCRMLFGKKEVAA